MGVGLYHCGCISQHVSLSPMAHDMDASSICTGCCPCEELVSVSLSDRGERERGRVMSVRVRDSLCNPCKLCSINNSQHAVLACDYALLPRGME